MKILLCTTTFRDVTNGPTKFANLLYENKFVNKTIEVHILSEDILEEKERLYKCEIGFLKKVLPIATVYRMIKYYRKANQLNKINQFDYIIYNNAIYGVIHAYFKANIVGMINDYKNQINISGDESVFKYEYIKRMIFSCYEKIAIKLSKLILTNSNYLTELLRNAYPGYASKIKRLYKGIDFSPASIKNVSDWEVENLDSIRILFVKNNYLTGGIKILGESLSLINLPFSVTIVGPDMKYSDQVKLFFQSGNVTLSFLGQQPQEKVFELLATHHVFCVPSLQEALGVANLEALNIGIPVVSSDAGGLNEVLNYGNCGFVTKAGDVQSLKSGIELCLFNKEQRVQKVLNGYEHVRKFKKEFIVENLQNILNEAI